MILSILICTLTERKQMFEALCNKLIKQMEDHADVEIIYDDGNGNVGTKRNRLLKEAKGKFIVFVDDDDDVYDNYVSSIIEVIKKNKKLDCIGIQGIITTNGKNPKQWFISMDHKTWHEKRGVFYRSTNHLAPVKRRLALKAMFPEIEYSEDHVYSMRLMPMLKTEVKITENIYHYQYVKK